MGTQAISQASLGIGRWTSTAKHDLGFTWRDPGDSSHGPRTFMYVKFTKGSGVDAYQGSPCGFLITGVTETNFQVACDVSVSPSTTPCGIIWNTEAAAVTTNYYGWIQLAVPHQILKSALLTSGAANNDLVVWEVDQNLATATAYTSIVEVVDTPFGVVCTGITQGATSTTVSTSTIGDVLVLLNPYIT